MSSGLNRKYVNWTYVGYLSGLADFSGFEDGSGKKIIGSDSRFQAVFKAGEYYVMFDNSTNCWFFTQKSVGIITNDGIDWREPHYTVQYIKVGSPESIKEHFTYDIGKHIAMTSVLKKDPVNSFNTLLDQIVTQFPDVIDYYAGEGSGADCYLAHTRRLTEKPIKKALGELRVIKKSVAHNEDQILRIDEFTELVELIKSRIANANSVDEIKTQLNTLDMINQEAKNIFMASIPKPGSQPQPKKEEKSSRQSNKPRFDLNSVLAEVSALSQALDMPLGTRGFSGGEQYYQDANSQYQNKVRATKARITQLHSTGATLATCKEEVAKLAKARKEYQEDINSTVRGAKNQRARGQMQKQVNDGCMASFIVLFLTGSLIVGGFSYTSYQLIASLF